MRRRGVLPQPVLLFRGGTSLRASEAFKLGFRPLKVPEHIEVKLMAREDLVRDALALYNNLREGAGMWRGFDRAFGVSIPEQPETLIVERNEEYVEGVKSIGNCDILLAIIPDEMWVPYENDPYMPLKRELAAKGLPSQMVEFSTASRLRDRGYVLLNIAVNIIAKVGGVPWGLAEHLHFDMVVGYDTVPGAVAAAAIADAKKPEIAWRVVENPEVEVARGVERMLEELILRVNKERPLQRILIIRDGLVHSSELKAIRRLIHKLREQEVLAEHFLYFLVSLRKAVPVKVLGYVGPTYYIPEKGTYVQIGKSEYLLMTTGYPDVVSELQTPPSPLMIVTEDTNYWEADPLVALRDIYWLTSLHYASPFRSPRLPIVILYPDRLMKFWRAGVKAKGELTKRLWFL